MKPTAGGPVPEESQNLILKVSCPGFKNRAAI